MGSKYKLVSREWAERRYAEAKAEKEERELEEKFERHCAAISEIATAIQEAASKGCVGIFFNSERFSIEATSFILDVVQNEGYNFQVHTLDGEQFVYIFWVNVPNITMSNELFELTKRWQDREGGGFE